MAEYLNLCEEIEEIKQHHKDGFTTIKQWYADESEPENVTGLKLPPHEILRQQAEEYFMQAVTLRETAVSFDSDVWDVDQFALYNSFYIFLAIGAEVLLNAIVLKHDPDFYLSKMGRSRSPHVNALRDHMLLLTMDDTTPDQRCRMKDVFELLKTHRNNLVHLGFYNHMMNKHPARILEVMAFLLTYFFEPDQDTVTVLRQTVEEHDEIDVGLDYPPVEFFFD